MRRSDILKNYLNTNKHNEQIRSTNRKTVGKPEKKNIPDKGTCIVREARKIKDGSICKCELLSNGNYSGIIFEAQSYGSNVSIGSVLSFFRNGNEISLISSGANTSTTTPASTVNYNLWGADSQL